MWKDHFGKIISGVGTALTLTIFWGGYSLLIAVAEVKAEQFVDTIMKQRAEQFNAPIKSELEQTKQQLRNNREQIDQLTQSLEQTNQLLQTLINQNRSDVNNDQ